MGFATRVGTVAGVVALAGLTHTWMAPRARAEASQSAPTAGGQAGGGGGFKQPEPYDFNDHEGWTSLFDGKTLNGCRATATGRSRTAPSPSSPRAKSRQVRFISSGRAARRAISSSRWK